MAYFKNIHSLAELKKEYRRLALENHPDKGGSTEVMQQINVEFERLHEIWKNDTTVSANASGYENDYAGASAKEYTDFVYNEYRWKGRNYQGQHTPEIVELVRNWMKETYPKYKFSVSRVVFQKVCLRRSLQILQICKYNNSCFQIHMPRRVDLIFVL